VLKAYTLRTPLCEILQWSFFLVDCLVAPEDIGAVCDVRREDGAIRCRRYMVTGGHLLGKVCTTIILRKMLDAEWIEVKAKVIADLNAAKAEIEAKTLVIFVYPIHKKLTHGSY
jgi:hypothetical protein